MTLRQSYLLGIAVALFAVTTYAADSEEAAKWPTERMAKNNDGHPVRIESAIPATVCVVEPIGTFERRTEWGKTPLSIQVSRANNFGYSLEVTFTNDPIPVILYPLTLQNASEGKDTVKIEAPSYGDEPKQEAAAAAVKVQLDKNLIDPTSPLLRWGKFAKEQYDDLEHLPRYCWAIPFEVNAKNRMGGYNGWKTCKAYFEQGKLVHIEVQKDR